MTTKIEDLKRLSSKIDTNAFIRSGSINAEKFIKKQFEKDERELEEIEALNICKKERENQKRIADAIYRFCNRGNLKETQD